MATKRVSEKKLVSASTPPVSSARKTSTPRRTSRSTPPVETPAGTAVEFEVATPVVAAPAVDQPSQETIAALAYSYWLARNCEGGSAEEDWFRAEQELRAASASA